MTHGALGAALVEAVRGITGQADVLMPVSNTGCDRKVLTERIREAAAGRPAIVFVDLPGGSCYQAAAAVEHDASSIRLVAGVNLAMLLDFVYHRDQAPDQAAARAAETGARAIQVIRP